MAGRTFLIASMPDSPKPRIERSGCLTAWLILTAVLSLISIPLAIAAPAMMNWAKSMNPAAAAQMANQPQPPGWYYTVSALFSAIHLGGAVWLWFWRRMGYVLIAAATCASLVIGYTTGAAAGWGAIVGPVMLTILGLLLWQPWEKMRWL
jgi:hypothetical protein